MSIYRKSADLAKKFDSEYPDELPARLEWWAGVLGIDRTSLLRLFGISGRQAAQKRNQDLKEILKNPEWEANAQLVEGQLIRLLTLFHYDWRALVAHIHGRGGGTEREGSSRDTPEKGEVSRLQVIPNGADPDLLINQMAEGGPQSLSALLAYLAASPAGANRVES